MHAGHAYVYGKQDKRATSLSSLLSVFGSLKENLVALFLVGSPSCLTPPGKKSTTLLNSGGILSFKFRGQSFFKALHASLNSVEKKETAVGDKGGD